MSKPTRLPREVLEKVEAAWAVAAIASDLRQADLEPGSEGDAGAVEQVAEYLEAGARKIMDLAADIVVLNNARPDGDGKTDDGRA